MPKNPDTKIMDNPALSDLEESNSSLSSVTKKQNVFSDITLSVETILDANKDDNTILSYDNEIGLIGIDVIQAHMKKFFNFEYPSLQALKISKQMHAVSVKGKGREQRVEAFKAFQTNVIAGDNLPISQRLLGRR
jgi:hypothetical protein